MEPVAFGIMSTASITTKVLPGMEKVVGVGSRDAAKAQGFCEQHAALPRQPGLGKGMLYDELVVHPDVEALYVPLPTGLRNAWIDKAIAAGKHVYSEKPMGGSVQDLKKILDACEQKGVQWMDGTMWYHSQRTKHLEGVLDRGDIGPVSKVSAAFTFAAPDEAWLNGGNGRTDKTREPMGCLGDQGWYPLAAILWAYRWELPQRVMAISTTKNTVDTIVACSGVLWFSNGRTGYFDCGVTSAHRSQFEIVGPKGVIKVDDLVGGQGRTGNFAAYEQKFTGSGRYVHGDAAGKDTVVEVPETDHVEALVDDFTTCVRAIRAGGKPDPDWPKRSLAVHTVMSAVFASAEQGGAMVDVVAA
jgi:predicted dehydrogenase